MKTTSWLVGLIGLNVGAWAGPEPGPRCVVHEWGTFTFAQGAGGLPQQWNPRVIGELPSCVYDRKP
jgi:hypothetical protein